MQLALFNDFVKTTRIAIQSSFIMHSVRQAEGALQPNEQNRREDWVGTGAIGVTGACKLRKVPGSENGSGTNSAKHPSDHLAIGS